MAVVQTLFEDALNAWSPVKTYVFMDNECCNSPMMDYFTGKLKPAAKQSSDGKKSRRCRTLRRTGTSLKTTDVTKSPGEFLKALSDVSSPDDVTASPKRRTHQFGTSLLFDEGSHDSGVRLDDSSEKPASLAEPLGVSASRIHLFEEDACSPLSYSPVKSNAAPTEFPSFPSSNSDDGFFEDIAAVDSDDNANMPGAFASLFKAPVICNKDADTEEFKIKKPVCLKLTGRLDSLEIRGLGGQKRRLDGEEDNPFMKRRRGAGGLVQRSCSAELPAKAKAAVPLRRCQSVQADIIKALDRAENDPDLIGDGSANYCLPTVPGKHQDLKSITPETLSKVLNHEYDHIIDKFVIVDCRYPYEFEGGHIRGGKNYYTKDSVMSNLMSEPLQPEDSEKRVALIFHCEFSSERAPKMSRFLRNMDRDQNKHCYPHLHYPEVYLLHAGYKNFFESHPNLCDPQSYTPMLHDDYKEDMRKFRLKSKSWAGDKKTKSARGRLGF